MIGAIGWGAVVIGVWVAGEIARAQQQGKQAAQPVPVRHDDAKQRPRR